MTEIVGLDLGTTAVRAVAVDPSGPRLTAFEERPVAEGQDPREILRAVASQKRFPRQRVWASLGSREALARDLTVPFTSPEQIQKTVRFSAEEVIAEEVESYLLDHEIIETREADSRLMILAARRADVARHLSELQQSGIDPEGLTFSGAALFNLAALCAKAEGVEGLFMLLDAGATTVDIVAGDSEKLRFCRSITVRGSEGLESPHKQERLFKEIRRTLWSGGLEGTLEVIYLCGGLAKLEGMPEKIAGSLGVTCRLLPVEKAFKGPLPPGDALPFAMAAGTALTGLGLGPLQINFRREEFVRTPWLLRLKAPLLALLLAACALLLRDGYLRNRNLGELKRTLAAHLEWEKAQFRSFFGDDQLETVPPQDIQGNPNWALEQFKERGQAFGRDLDVLPDVLESLMMLQAHLVQFPGFQLESISVDANVVSLRGSIPSRDELDKLENSLANDQIHFKGDPSTQATENKDVGIYNFAMTLRLAKKGND
ncbi:MAG: hypothetical protein AB7F75_01900 [Planctomycetota bacterium]